ATWQEAFIPQHFIVHQENLGAAWRTHEHYFPPNAAVPGDGGALPSPLEYAELLAGMAVDFYRRALGLPSAPLAASRVERSIRAVPDTARRLSDRRKLDAAADMLERVVASRGLDRMGAWLGAVEGVFRALPAVSPARLKLQLEVVALVLARFTGVLSSEM